MHSGPPCPSAQSRGCLETQHPSNSRCSHGIQYYRVSFCIFGSFFTGHTTTFPFTYFPFLFPFLHGQSIETLSTNIWLPPFGTFYFPPSPSRSPLIKKGAHSHQGGLSERWRNGKEDDDRICWDIKGSPGIWLPIIESNKASRKKIHRSVIFRQT